MRALFKKCNNIGAYSKIYFVSILMMMIQSKSKKFLFERISLAIQRGNVASIRGNIIGNFCIIKQKCFYIIDSKN
jgi:hypothetical protein